MPVTKVHKTFRCTNKTIKQLDYLSRKLAKKGEPDLSTTDTLITAIQVLHDQFRDGYQLSL